MCAVSELRLIKSSLTHLGQPQKGLKRLLIARGALPQFGKQAACQTHASLRAPAASSLAISPLGDERASERAPHHQFTTHYSLFNGAKINGTAASRERGKSCGAQQSKINATLLGASGGDDKVASFAKKRRAQAARTNQTLTQAISFLSLLRLSEKRFFSERAEFFDADRNKRKSPISLCAESPECALECTAPRTLFVEN
jgi:hypothetical protein